MSIKIIRGVVPQPSSPQNSGSEAADSRPQPAPWTLPDDNPGDFASMARRRAFVRATLETPNHPLQPLTYDRRQWDLLGIEKVGEDVNGKALFEAVLSRAGEHTFGNNLLDIANRAMVILDGRSYQLKDVTSEKAIHLEDAEDGSKRIVSLKELKGKEVQFKPSLSPYPAADPDRPWEVTGLGLENWDLAVTPRGVEEQKRRVPLSEVLGADGTIPVRLKGRENWGHFQLSLEEGQLWVTHQTESRPRRRPLQDAPELVLKGEDESEKVLLPRSELYTTSLIRKGKVEPEQVRGDLGQVTLQNLGELSVLAADQGASNRETGRSERRRPLGQGGQPDSPLGYLPEGRFPFLHRRIPFFLRSDAENLAEWASFLRKNHARIAEAMVAQWTLNDRDSAPGYPSPNSKVVDLLISLGNRLGIHTTADRLDEKLRDRIQGSGPWSFESAGAVVVHHKGMFVRLKDGKLVPALQRMKDRLQHPLLVQWLTPWLDKLVAKRMLQQYRAFISTGQIAGFSALKTDLFARFRGEEAQLLFELQWLAMRPDRLRFPLHQGPFPEGVTAENYAHNPTRATLLRRLAGKGIFFNDPVLRKAYATKAFLRTIENAQENLQVHVSDFLDPIAMQAVLDAARRGVKVTLRVREDVGEECRALLEQGIAEGLPIDFDCYDKRILSPHYNLTVADAGTPNQRALVGTLFPLTLTTVGPHRAYEFLLHLQGRDVDRVLREHQYAVSLMEDKRLEDILPPRA